MLEFRPHKGPSLMLGRVALGSTSLQNSPYYLGKTKKKATFKGSHLPESLCQKDLHTLMRLSEKFTQPAPQEKKRKSFKKRIESIKNKSIKQPKCGTKKEKTQGERRVRRKISDYKGSKFPVFSTHYYMAGKVPDSSKKLKLEQMDCEDNRSNLKKRRKVYSINKNIPKHTRASSNEKIFNWDYSSNVSLKKASEKVCDDWTKETRDIGESKTDTTQCTSNKSSIGGELQYKCLCGKHESHFQFCTKASEWIKLAFDNYSRSFDRQKDSEIFNDILTLSNSGMNIEDSLNQIKNDINRTVQNNDYFQAPNHGYRKIYDVLKAFTIYDKTCGYVQGMNFIIAALVYHCDSISAFWLFTSLMEDYNLHKNYVQGLEGFYERAEDISSLLKESNTELFTFFEENYVTLEMIALEPIMSLFCNLIPLDLSSMHFSAFFKNGWKYFNNLFIKFLEEISPQLYLCEDQYEILSCFKNLYHSRASKTEEIIDLKKNLDWKLIIEKAES